MQVPVDAGLDERKQPRAERGLHGQPLTPTDLRTAASPLAVRRVADVALQHGPSP